MCRQTSSWSRRFSFECCLCSSFCRTIAVGPSTSPSTKIPPLNGWLTNCSKPSPGIVRRVIFYEIVMGATERDFVKRQTDWGFGEVLTAPQSPWQNAYIERLIGSIGRECLDHMIVLNETGLRRILKSYFEYYERTRTHMSLGKDAPVSRPIQPAQTRPIVEIPQVVDCIIDTSESPPDQSAAILYALDSCCHPLSGSQRWGQALKRSRTNPNDLSSRHFFIADLAADRVFSNDNSLSSFQNQKIRNFARIVEISAHNPCGYDGHLFAVQPRPEVRRQQRQSAPRLCREPRSDALSPARWRCASRAYPRWDSASRSHEWFAGSGRPSP